MERIQKPDKGRFRRKKKGGCEGLLEKECSFTPKKKKPNKKEGNWVREVERLPTGAASKSSQERDLEGKYWSNSEKAGLIQWNKTKRTRREKASATERPTEKNPGSRATRP